MIRKFLQSALEAPHIIFLRSTSDHQRFNDNFENLAMIEFYRAIISK